MPKEQVKFEVKSYLDENNMVAKGIFVNDRLFDWGIDEESYKDALKMDSKYHRIIQADIAKHFLDCLSAFMDRQVTRKEVDEATKTGLIDK